jgi:hypothetical protein
MAMTWRHGVTGATEQVIHTPTMATIPRRSWRTSRLNWSPVLAGTGLTPSGFRSLRQRGGDLILAAPRLTSMRRRAVRVERVVLASVPMVARATRRDAQPQPAAPQPQEVRSSLVSETDPRGAWSMTLPGPLSGVVPPATLASLTEHVVREINDRVRAKRERLGKV